VDVGVQLLHGCGGRRAHNGLLRRRLPGQRLLDRGQTRRVGAGPGQSDSCGLEHATLHIHRGRNADNSEVRRTLVKLRVGRRLDRDELDAGDDLVRRQIDRKEPLEKVARLDGPPSLWPLDVNLGVECQHRGRVVRSRIGMSKAATDRAAVSHLRVADLDRGIRDDRARLLEQRRRGDVVVRRGRTDFDLSQHAKYSKKKIQYFDNDLNEEGKPYGNYTPYVVETSVGLDRLFLTVLSLAYADEKWTKEDGTEDGRVVLRIPAKIAPMKLAILPLLKKDGLPEIAKELMNECKPSFHCFYEEKDAIGKRYRRMDAIGTPFCVTIDHQTKEDNTVTIRYRDDMRQ